MSSDDKWQDRPDEMVEVEGIDRLEIAPRAGPIGNLAHTQLPFSVFQLLAEAERSHQIKTNDAVRLFGWWLLYNLGPFGS